MRKFGSELIIVSHKLGEVSSGEKLGSTACSNIQAFLGVHAGEQMKGRKKKRKKYERKKEERENEDSIEKRNFKKGG